MSRYRKPICQWRMMSSFSSCLIKLFTSSLKRMTSHIINFEATEKYSSLFSIISRMLVLHLNKSFPFVPSIHLVPVGRLFGVDLHLLEDEKRSNDLTALILTCLDSLMFNSFVGKILRWCLKFDVMKQGGNPFVRNWRSSILKMIFPVRQEIKIRSFASNCVKHISTLRINSNDDTTKRNLFVYNSILKWIIITYTWPKRVDNVKKK